MICYHAHHIEKVHWYARRCVRNNHAISEAVCLLTVGLLFPASNRGRDWKNMGMAALVRELKWQVYPDGGYVQHSMNYSRMIVQLLNWVLALAETHKFKLPDIVRNKGLLLLEFLKEFQNPITGELPNYGLNDGTLLFPLSDCEYRDFRPSLNTMSRLLGRGCLYGEGSWEEEARWFMDGAQSEPAASQVRDYDNRDVEIITSGDNRSKAFLHSGYCSFRGTNTHALFRCGRNRHRPHEADMMQLDIWYHGYNILIDPGTCSYNASPRWRDYFAGTGAHNTLTVDGKSQMRSGSRFLWHGWTQGVLLPKAIDSLGVNIKGCHYGYDAGIHTRSVDLCGSVYRVRDEFQPPEGEVREDNTHFFRLHWLFPDCDIERCDTGGIIHLPGQSGKVIKIDCCTSPKGTGEWVMGEMETPRGWHSTRYGQKHNAWSFSYTTQGAVADFLTIIGPPDEIAEGRDS